MTNLVLPEAAIRAAKEAMREVTPPPGVSKADWLAEHGDFALIAGAIAAAAPHMQTGEVEWTVFCASDGENRSPAENLRYSTKAGAQESIDTRYGTPELWEPRSRIVGEWHK